MKKIIAALSSVIAVVVLCVCMAACSTGIEGTWKFDSMTSTYEDQTVTLKVGDDIPGAPAGTKITADYMTLEVKKDGTFSVKEGGEEGETMTGKWEKKDGKYLFTIGEGEDAETQEYKLDGKTLVSEESGEGYSMKVVLKK